MHIIFSTKYRQPLIIDPVADQLYSYLGGICKNLECNPIKIGGLLDHVHILSMISKKITVTKLLEQLKSHSSAWMKLQGPSLANFYWQNGYGAFSVSRWDVETVKRYIEAQAIHHQEKTFQEEYRKVLEEYQMEY